MTATELKVSKMSLEEIMALSGEERFKLGAQMFEEFRADIVASLPPGLTETERRRMIYERTYDEPAPPELV